MKYRWYLLLPLILFNALGAYGLMKWFGVIVVIVAWIFAIFLTVGLTEIRERRNNA
jgi:hypothetical protein